MWLVLRVGVERPKAQGARMGSGASKATSSFSEQEVRARRRKERQSTHNIPLSHVQASPVVAELAAGRVYRHGDGRHPASSNGYVYHPHGIYIERPCVSPAIVVHGE